MPAAAQESVTPVADSAARRADTNPSALARERSGSLPQPLVSLSSRQIPSALRTLIVPALAALMALAAYLHTLAPSISQTDGVADSGELAAAAYVLGVPHATGYPLYMLAGWAVSHLPFGEPAYLLNMFSAGCGAIAAGLTAALIGLLLRAGSFGCGRVAGTKSHLRWLPAAVGRQLSLPDRRSYHEQIGTHSSAPIGAAALAAALFFAATPSFWMQATNTETRALAAMLVAAVLVALVAASCLERQRLLLLAWSIMGLALADHLLALAVLPALLVATATMQGVRKGIVGRVRLCGYALLALLPGLTLYAYLPLRAGANPSLNWGAPNTFARFLWLVTGAQYRSLMGPAPGAMLSAFNDRAQTLIANSGVLLLVSAALGFALLCGRHRRAALLLGLTFLTGFLQSSFYGAAAAPQYLIPCEITLAATAGYLLGVVLRACITQIGCGRGRWHFAWGMLLGVALCLTAAALAGEIVQHPTTTAADSRLARGYALASLQGLPPRALVLVEGDADTFPLWYAQFALHVRPDVAVVSTDLLAWQWYAQSVRAHYPWLRWDGAVWPGADHDLGAPGRDSRAAARELALLHANLRHIPIFWGSPDDLTPEYCGLEPEGNLFHCVPLLHLSPQ